MNPEAETVKRVLFTYGYTGRDLADLKGFVRDGATILDIRLSPKSRVPRWRQASLQQVLGEAYVWEPALGNRRYREGPPVEIADLEAGLATLESLFPRGPVVLLCGCENPHACHRHTVAEAARERWPELAGAHLAPGEEIPVTVPFNQAVEMLADGDALRAVRGAKSLRPILLTGILPRITVLDLLRSAREIHIAGPGSRAHDLGLAIPFSDTYDDWLWLETRPDAWPVEGSAA